LISVIVFAIALNLDGPLFPHRLLSDVGGSIPLSLLILGFSFVAHWCVRLVSPPTFS